MKYNYKKTEIEKEFGKFNFAGISYSQGDITRIIEKPNEEYQAGILLGDTKGHSKKLKNIVEKRIRLVEKSFSPQWYSEKNALCCLSSLSYQLNKKRPKSLIVEEDINLTCLLYCLFENNSLNISNASMPAPLILPKEGDLYYLKDNIPQIGFLSKAAKKHPNTLKRIDMNKGDIIFFYTDGAIENPLFKQLIPIDTENIPNRVLGEIYINEVKKKITSGLELVLKENSHKNPNEIIHEILDKYGKYIIPNKNPEDDLTLGILKVVK